MPAITVKLQIKDLQAAQTRARRQGFKTASAWVKFLIEQNIILEESPRLKPSKIISEMQKTGLYKPTFLRELEKSLKYADKTN